MIALCYENETREWDGVEWIRLEGNGWINGMDVCNLLPLFVSDALMVHISHYSPFFLFQRQLSIRFPPPGFNFILENLFHLYSFLSFVLSFFLSPPPPFFSRLCGVIIAEMGL